MTSQLLPTKSSTAKSRLRRLKEEKLRRLRARAEKREGFDQAEWDRCALDVVYWVDNYCWTYDPRLETDKYRPFRLFPRQIEFLRWLENRERVQANGLVEKSRDCGASYLCCAFSLHRWVFEAGYSVGFGSRKEDLVDKAGDPDSLFEKLRIMLTRLPEWQLPVGFTETKHSAHMKLVNPASGATITGEAGENIGRGGRKSIYFTDEESFLANPEAVERSLSDTTRVRISVSTPNGPGNPFAKKRFSGRIKVFTFHWKDDPRKNHWCLVPRSWAPALNEDEQLILREEDVAERGQLPNQPAAREGCKCVFPWYEQYKLTHDEVTVAQEADIDYNASIEGICIPAKWVNASIGLLESAEFRAAYPDYRPSGGVIAGYDVAGGGKNKNVVIGRHGPRVMMPEAWGGLGPTQSAWRAARAAEAINAATMHYDVIGVGLATQDAYNMAVAEDEGKPKTQRRLQFVPNAVNVGEPPTERKWPGGKTAKQMFVNKRAEIWWTGRERFRKAFEFRTEGIQHAPEEMISLPAHPSCPDLIAELSMPLVFENETGKIQLEAKKDMAKRGVASPDHADALMLTMEPEVNWNEAAAAIIETVSEFAEMSSATW